MGFELFTAKKSTSRSPTVAILKGGGMFFNSAFYENFLSKNKYINLYYDKERKLIGIKPTDKCEPYSYPIKANAQKTGCSISAVSFCNLYKINFDKTRRFSVAWNPELQLVEVKLS